MTPPPARCTAASTGRPATATRPSGPRPARIVTYKGKVALTQFASSNGGHSAQGDFPYLAPKKDPYDGVITSQAWTRTISAGSIANKWPSVGTVKKLKVTRRDGDGAWGGRVNSMKIIGSKKTITITGYTFYYRYGLRSRLFKVA